MSHDPPGGEEDGLVPRMEPGRKPASAGRHRPASAPSRADPPIPRGLGLAARGAGLAALRLAYPVGVGAGSAALLAAGGLIPVARDWLDDRLSSWPDLVRRLGGIPLPRPPRDPDTDLGLALRRPDAPLLFQALAELCRRAGCRPPDSVRLTYLPCCGVVGSGAASTRRVLLIGIPLFHVLDAAELRAALAHEVSHLAHGDELSAERATRFLDALGRELDGAAPRGPLAGWARFCLARGTRLARPLALGHEARADRFAAASAGGPAAASALVKVALVQPLFREALSHYEATHDPSGPTDLYAFFRSFWDRLPVELMTLLRHRLLSAPPEPDSLHPPLLDRLALVQSYPALEFPPEGRASAWLGDPPALEQRLHERMFGMASVERTVFHKAGS
jgi:Zn-dependent protease with chaperone function